MAVVTSFLLAMRKSISLLPGCIGMISVAVTAASPVSAFAQATVSPAAVIAGQLVTPGTTIQSVTDFTAVTDPDLLLAAPGQYIAKARFVDSAGVVGDVEVFANARDERTRARGLIAVVTAGQELDIEQGLVLVRFYNLLAGDQAYRDALTRAVTFS